jgi:membrane protease YdiL (CAAX protease family)
VSHLSLDVAREEVLYRFILLGTLLLFLSPAWAIGISSLVFALTHAVLPWIITQEMIPTLSPVLPAFFMGICFGTAFFWYGLPAALAVHFGMNLASAFASDHTYIADSIMFGSAFVALVILPITLWFSRKKHALMPQAR